jgi:S-adenosylmethionine:tRNA ribosyltransferase-isomerase
MNAREIRIEDYVYDLPPDRIAHHPLEERHDSKLLVYKAGEISEDIYKNLTGYIPSESMLVFNNTKVIPARLLFTKETGATIEIFCLEPHAQDHSSVMSSKGTCTWKTMIGGASKWKSRPLIKRMNHDGAELTFEARLVEKLSDSYLTRFSWTPEQLTFAEMLQAAGSMPLPPYIKRPASVEDKNRYQTIYAATEGSVAAPTAGLHFSSELLTSLDQHLVKRRFVTLHVSAGTFRPVKAEQMKDHQMHAEWIDVEGSTLMQLAEHEDLLFAVGTTAARTLESLYWMGLKTMINPNITIDSIGIRQWEVYDQLHSDKLPPKTEAFKVLAEWLKANDLGRLLCTTELMIAPGYRFQTVDGIITNFHQPGSTLLLLVAAAVGDDWRKIYDYALQHEFRFLSYGDGSLLYVKQ